MDHIENMFPFNLFDAKWFQSSVVSVTQSKASLSSGGGSKAAPAPSLSSKKSNGSVAKVGDEGGKTSLYRTSSQVPTVAEMKKVFDQFDENKDGVICSNELRNFMEKLGFSITDDEVKALVTTVDENKNQSVDFDEFYKLYSSLSGVDQSSDEKANEEEHEKNLKSAFQVFDKNNDGFISVEELQLVLKSLGMKEGHSFKKCQQMISGVDADGNGKVDFQEFKKLMSSDGFQW
ncbi:unnamed protein product [Calypogeia fissa]